ncbi:hypothetical protein SDC9_135718 [bioreactor metagenome]|uniref:Uncharacterized protein n=1 Tax=bioreactor metagenome TaxID=1076179 RepID=A0A645DGM1_9ZZZZ
MEGPLVIVGDGSAAGTSGRNDRAATSEIWRRLNDEIRESMHRVTLQDIIDRDRKRNVEKGCFDYCI